MNDKVSASKSKKNSLEKKKKLRKLESDEDDDEEEEDNLDESSEEELDLTKECHSIGYYINDRAEMINQMFSVIKGNKLKAMLPPVLKDCDVEHLKLECLDQLLGMSEKRINCILEGETLETSSESEVVSEDDEANESSSGEKSQRSRDNSSDSNSYEMEESEKSRKNKRKANSKHESSESKAPKLDSTGRAPEQGKTLLEILELEMRARAIRALLLQGNEAETSNAGVQKSTQDDENKDKEVSGDVVDLTGCDDEDDFPLPSSKKVNPAEVDIDKKVSSFEMKVEKAKEQDKVNNTEEEKVKKQKLQAELELRNKLFKKKIYRTRQQRMENDEEREEDNSNSHDTKSEQSINISIETIKIKEEPVAPEVVIEDPEEGEISSEEEFKEVQIKQEVVEPEETNDVTDSAVPEEESEQMDMNKLEGAEFITSYPIGPENDNITTNEESNEPPETQEKEDNIEHELVSKASDEVQKDEEVQEDSSWLGRWLQNNEVQKLVKSSKICAKVKKRMKYVDKNLKLTEAAPSPSDVNSDSNSTSTSKFEVIEGSVQEYERLSSKIVEQDSKNVDSETCVTQTMDSNDVTQTMDLNNVTQTIEEVTDKMEVT